MFVISLTVSDLETFTPLIKSVTVIVASTTNLPPPIFDVSTMAINPSVVLNNFVFRSIVLERAMDFKESSV